MDLLSLGALALKVGPMAIRGISSLFGGSDTANKVADAVEQADKAFSSPKDKQAAIVEVLQNMPPECHVELERLEVEMQREITERQRIYADDRQAEHGQTQQTIRAGDRAQDEYVRRTRPWGCRKALLWGIAYIFIFELLEAINYGTGADWQIISFLFAPFLTYLGWRTVDKRHENKHGQPLTLNTGMANAGNGIKAFASKLLGTPQ